MNDIEKVLDTTSETTIDIESPETALEQISEQDQPQQESPTTEEIPASPSSQHFKAVRQLKEKAERERDNAIRHAVDLEAKLTGFQSSQNIPENDDIMIGSDDFAEGKHVKQLSNEIRKLRAEVKQQQQQSSTSIIEARLKIEYPDIERVVTKENIEILEMQEPDIASTINDSQDLYKKAVAAYKLIKKYGIQAEDNYSQDRSRAQINASKPRPLTSISPQQGDSPLSHANAFANGLTDELKAQ